MAVLLYQDGASTDDLQTIQQELASLNVTVNRWPVNEDDSRKLAAQAALSDEQKEQLLVGLDNYFEQLKREQGYVSRDLIVLHPELDGLEGMLAKFESPHTHADDEVRYIVDGEGVFGFVRPDGSQVELVVEAEDYINVPKNVEHWFRLTSKKRIKAVRYFSGKDGWTPEYTETKIQMKRG